MVRVNILMGSYGAIDLSTGSIDGKEMDKETMQTVFNYYGAHIKEEVKKFKGEYWTEITERERSRKEGVAREFSEIMPDSCRRDQEAEARRKAAWEPYEKKDGPGNRLVNMFKK